MDAHVMEDERAQMLMSPAEEGSRFPVEIRIAPDAPWGSYLGNVEVTVRGRLGEGGEEITHSLRVGVIAELYGKVHASDSRFRLGMFPPGDQFESKVRLFSPSGGTFDVLNARMEPALPNTDVIVQPVPAPGGSAYEIVVRGTGGPRETFLRGDVVIETDMPGEQLLTIPYSGRIRK
jgi:hypothetical protein